MNVRPWKWKERSTRNCVHARVYVEGGEERVRCDLGRRLSGRYLDRYYGISLKTVLRRSGFLSEACRECPYFERDVRGD